MISKHESAAAGTTRSTAHGAAGPPATLAIVLPEVASWGWPVRYPGR